MGKKKKRSGRSLSLLQKVILLVFGLCLSYFLLIGVSYMPGVRTPLDFAVRNRAKAVLDAAFPNYQMETVSADPKKEKDNILTVGFLSKEQIRQILMENNAQQGYVRMPFINYQLRIREFFITPLILLCLLFLFTPIKWKIKLLGLLGGLLILYGLLSLKLRAIAKFEIVQTYFPEKAGFLQRITPYFSSPGLVFLVILIIWMAIIFPFVDFKKLTKSLGL